MLIKVGAEPRYLAVGAGSVWVTSYDSGDVYRIDPTTDKVVQRIAVGPGPQGISVDRHGVHVDAASGRVAGRVRTGPQTRGIAVGAGGAWVATSAGSTLSHVVRR